MLKSIAAFLIRRSETRIGVKLDYAHKIAQTDFGLLMRYNKIFGMIDPNTKVPAIAYHTARLRGAMAADCGTCVEAEINLAKLSNIAPDVIDTVLRGSYDQLSSELAAVAELTDATVRDRIDNSDARDHVISAYGDAGLIELSLAMNGAAMLPGIKRAMGYAVQCDLSLMSKLAHATR